MHPNWYVHELCGLPPIAGSGIEVVGCADRDTLVSCGFVAPPLCAKVPRQLFLATKKRKQCGTGNACSS